MDNKSISENLVLLADLKELFGEDPFRISGVRNAARKISKMAEPLAIMDLAQLQSLEGIGKSMAKTILQINETGQIKELEELKTQVPIGIIQMLDIPGIGPKKVNIIWKTLGIESIGELRYACNENRLIEAKGFGIKTQNEILKNLDFFEGNEGLILYPKMKAVAQIWIDKILSLSFVSKAEIVGDLRRKMEFLSEIEILVSLKPNFSEPADLFQKEYEKWAKESETLNSPSELKIKNSIQYPEVLECSLETFQGIPLKFCWVDENRFIYYSFLYTGSQNFIEKLDIAKLNPPEECVSEEIIFKKLGLSFLEPELRENWDEIYKDFLKLEGSYLKDEQKKAYYPISSGKLIEVTDLKGALHNHSTYSDGINTLEEMAKECQTLGLQYFGICDHSRAAFYANGLSIERVKDQQLEIEKLNQSFQGFKIFKGIESDILNDGSLDYPDEILKSFDFVVASVHTNLKMEKSKAMARILTAIENPYTTILGHPTSRLLLGRQGYPLDMEIVIEACVKNQVVIEINANPHRLDIDWRWIHYGLEKGALFSINPDAHKKEGLKDMEYGVGIARKGGLNSESCLNCFGLEKIERYFKERKSSK